MRNIQMAKGAHTVVNRCARVKPGETVVIVTEPSRMSIAEELGAAVCAAGGEPVFCSILPRERDGQEPPAPVAAAMKAADVFLCVVGKSITHTQAVKEAVAQGARGLVLTHFTEEMLVRGGIEPTIEANVSPLEGTANGVIVADASIPYIGIGVLEEPVVCHVRDGRITSIEGGRQAQMLKDDLASKADPNVYNIAEMGMGLNPKCHFCGFMLEDEGVEGSVHIGIGTSITLGGTVKAACHYDLIMTGATVVADGRVLLQDGVVQL